ncbi:MAG: methenyltetrahydromethanopterin cyclohydrolase [Candidatus Methylomirabilota bacterium]|nr:MAG: methenyltetrahydromethanopterin cyclohydrolase [candidate division NC10 bacterium]
MSLSLNRQAVEILDRMSDKASALGISVSTLKNGARLVDLGVKAPGGLLAGKGLAEICLGGLGEVSFLPLDYGDFSFSGISVAIDGPVLPCLGSQYAGWRIQRGKFFGMGSGPARALARTEELYETIRIRDDADSAVLVLESGRLPDEDVAEYVAEKCGVTPDRVSLAVAATRSVAGAVQIAARSVETAMHKLLELDFDVTKALSGFGTCPIATPAADDLTAIGRTNDCVLYGAKVYLTVSSTDDEIAALIDKVPSCASRDYGQLFRDLFKRYDGDFYKIDPFLFSPAKIAITNAATGRTFRAGRFNAELLQTSLLS